MRIYNNSWECKPNFGNQHGYRELMAFIMAFLMAFIFLITVKDSKAVNIF
jgi:hypothetical protein